MPEPRCIAFGGLRVDDTIEAAILKVLEPGTISAALEADRQEAIQRDEVCDALSRDLEAARYAADHAFRQYDAIDPANRLVAAELERRWNQALTWVSEVEARIAAHDRRQPPSIRSHGRIIRNVGRRPEVGLGCSNDRCTAEEAHCSHADPRGHCRH